MYIYHIFFIHSSVDRPLGWFHILDIINNAALNITVHVSFQISVSVFSNIYPGVELLGHMIVLFLVFWETSILFSIVATSIYLPFLLAVYKGSFYSASSWKAAPLLKLFRVLFQDIVPILSQYHL